GAGKLLSNSASNILVERKTIHGILDVNTNYTFDGTVSDRSMLYLGAGAEIIVRSGSTLTLTNTDLFTCSVLAQGITVEPGGTLIVSDCTLKDSRFAIDAKPGSTISVKRTGFFDNYIGLHLDMGSAAEANKRVNILEFEDNTFSTAQTAINTPFSGMPEAIESRGYCGIWLNDYRDFNIFAPTNTFSALANGIIARKSTLNLGNMTFDDMNSVGTPVYPLEGFGIHLWGKGNRPYWAHINEMWHTMTFNNCKTGIFGSHYSAQVDNVVMTNVTTGIDWSQSIRGEIRLRSNTITARQFGIRSFQNEPLASSSAISDNTIVVTTAGGGLTPVTGIEMQEPGLGTWLGGGWPVTKNSVTMNIGGRGILYRNGVSGVLDGNFVTNLSMPNSYTGIFTEGNYFTNVARNTVTQNSSIGLGAATGILSASGTVNTYQCNCIDNTHVGAQFNDFGEFVDAVRGNSFNTHTTGLQIGHPGAGGAYIGNQTRTGNLWDLGEIPTGEFGGINNGSLADALRSRFLVPGVMGSNVEHPDVDPSPGWFFQGGSSSFTCSNACVFPPTTNIPSRVPESYVPTNLDYAIVTGTLSDNTDMAWKGNYRLYRKLLRQPAMEQYDTVFASFKAAQATLPSGKLGYIAEERAKLFSLNSTDEATDANYRSTLTSQTANLRNLDSLSQSGTSINTTTYNTLVQQKAANETNYAAFLLGIDTMRQLHIQTLLTLNANISTPTVCIANHKTVNNIVLNMLANGDDEPSPTNLTVLSDIAAQCPIEGGDAVYEARAVVERFTGETFDDAVLCAIEARPSNGRDSNVRLKREEVIVYPNPSTGQIFWSGLEGQSLYVRVFNQLGQLVAERNTTGNSLDLSNLPEGVYQVQFSCPETKLLLNRSLVIQKR
ncbi:MAG: T9SS type A sorting domain-containing protein, partial [Saprospiraceae bacterium]|nr:T9SS type A sorting domain-containing protein [Saprospiraceae bacterium]